MGGFVRLSVVLKAALPRSRRVPRRTRMRWCLVQAGRCWPRQGPTGHTHFEEGVEVCLIAGSPRQRCVERGLLRQTGPIRCACASEVDLACMRTGVPVCRVGEHEVELSRSLSTNFICL